jgi:hypothetical protein
VDISDSIEYYHSVMMKQGIMCSKTQCHMKLHWIQGIPVSIILKWLYLHDETGYHVFSDTMTHEITLDTADSSEYGNYKTMLLALSDILIGYR